MRRAPIFVGAIVLGAAAAALGAFACSSPPSDARIGVDLPPQDDTNWHPVELFLDRRCGTLDCHGNAQRNLVIWGCAGLRSDPTMYPNCQLPKLRTTTDEYTKTFRSLVGLEPAVMSAVVSGGGKDPELLTFVRKARAQESHKGNQLIVPGDPQDVCITSWLAGTTDQAACACAQYIAANGLPPGSLCSQDAGSE